MEKMKPMVQCILSDTPYAFDISKQLLVKSRSFVIINYANVLNFAVARVNHGTCMNAYMYHEPIHDLLSSFGRRFLVPFIFSILVLTRILWGVLGVRGVLGVGVMLDIICTWGCCPIAISWVAVTCGRWLPRASSCSCSCAGSASLSRMRRDHDRRLIWELRIAI